MAYTTILLAEIMPNYNATNSTADGNAIELSNLTSDFVVDKEQGSWIGKKKRTRSLELSRFCQVIVNIISWVISCVFVMTDCDNLPTFIDNISCEIFERTPANAHYNVRNLGQSPNFGIANNLQSDSCNSKNISRLNLSCRRAFSFWTSIPGKGTKRATGSLSLEEAQFFLKWSYKQISKIIDSI